MNFADIPNPSKAVVEPVAPVVDTKVPAQEQKPELKAGLTELSPTGNKEATVAKRKYRVNDQDIELTDEESTAWVQKAMHADAQIKEAAQLKKSTAALIEKLKTPKGLREILSDPSISVDRKQLAIEWVKEYMAEEAMDPKDRELRDSRAELESYKAKEAEIKEKAEQEAKQAEVKQQADAFRSEIIGVMEANSGVLPKSQAVMDRIIGYMRAGYRKTGKVLPAAEAVKYVIADYEGEVGEISKSADINRLLKLLGPEAIEKIRKADLAQLKKDLASGLKTPASPELHKDVKKDRKGRISEKEFNKQIFGGL